MSTPNRTLVSRFFDEICNQKKLELADELFSATHTHHDPSSPWVGPGPDGMKQLIGQYQRAFPDAKWQVEEMMDAGDNTVVTRWTGRGTHKGELMGLSPTGRQVAVPGIWIHRISGGRIVESWSAWDALGMLQQLGVVQGLGQPGGRAKA
jgi:steroid delta-isomerase-like uncharacterized protein